ncbi:hypothetical protein H8959_017827 [Pygathrix nigripes]
MFLYNGYLGRRRPAGKLTDGNVREEKGKVEAKGGKLRGGGSRNRDWDRLPSAKRTQNGGGSGGGGGGSRVAAVAAAAPPEGGSEGRLAPPQPPTPPSSRSSPPSPSPPDSSRVARTPARKRTSVYRLVAGGSHQPPPSAAQRASQPVRAHPREPPRPVPHSLSGPVKPPPAQTLTRTFSGASPSLFHLLFPLPRPPTAAKAAAASTPATPNPRACAFHRPHRGTVPFLSAAGAGEEGAGKASLACRLTGIARVAGRVPRQPTSLGSFPRRCGSPPPPRDPGDRIEGCLAPLCG